MSYTEQEFGAARALFEKEIERWAMPFNCSYCSYPGMLGYRTQGDSAFMHPDCFQLHRSEISQKTPIDLLMDIGQKETPRVYFDKKALHQLIDSAVEKFPLQHNYFLIGDTMDGSVEIKDYIPVPYFVYPREPGTFGSWSVRDPSDGELEQLNKVNVVGYLHSHNAKLIGHSDLLYESYYSLMLDDDEKNMFNVHVQLDSFHPVLKELTLLNHEQFDGKKPLTGWKGLRWVPTSQLEKYLQDDKGDYFNLLQDAKGKALEKIKSEPQNYVGTYSTILDVVGGERDIALFEGLEQWMGTGNLSVDAFSDLELIKRIRGKIKQLPFEVRQIA